MNAIRYSPLLTLLLLPALAILCLSEEPAKDTPGKRPIVVMKQAEIRGRVFFLPEGEEEAEDVRAVGQRVLIRTLDGADVLHKTATDKNGEYSIPNLDTGKYQMVVGRLVLELHVAEPGGKALLKNIVIFIPRMLQEKGGKS